MNLQNEIGKSARLKKGVEAKPKKLKNLMFEDWTRVLYDFVSIMIKSRRIWPNGKEDGY